MEKIAIIGSPGSGKTTLAKILHRKLSVKVYHLDRLFWKSGWQRMDEASRVDTMSDLIREKQWIIEGTYLRSSEPRLNYADTIIFLDTHPFICLWRVIKRHRKGCGHFRRDIPEGCVDKLNLQRILKLLAFPIQERIKLKRKLLNYEYFGVKEIIRLRSQKDLKEFLARMELNAIETEASVRERNPLSDSPVINLEQHTTLLMNAEVSTRGTKA